MTATVASPWLTVKQAAEYAGRHPQTIYTALRQYVASKQKRGLRGIQRVPNGSWRVARPDLDAWIENQPPRRRRPA